MSEDRPTLLSAAAVSDSCSHENHLRAFVADRREPANHGNFSYCSLLRTRCTNQGPIGEFGRGDKPSSCERSKSPRKGKVFLKL